MVVTLIAPSACGIDTPGFAHYVFTPDSTRALSLPRAVAFARTHRAVLQSAREAVAFRIASAGPSRYQLTRTCAIYFRDGGVFFVAFDDDPEHNLLLARAQEAYDAYTSGDEWLVNKNDPLITACLRRAEITGRVVAIPLIDNVMFFSTLPTDGGSPYGSSPFVRALIGDLAEHYAEFLVARGCSAGILCVLTHGALDRLNIDDQTVLVRHVTLGGGDAIYAESNHPCGGRPRGVRENPTGNKG
jgi:hypothetical protein